MKIEYTYKIINVNKEAKSMIIVYESPKYGKLQVGARLPWKDETIEAIVEMYNPVRYWLEQEMETLDVEPGLEGGQELEFLENNSIEVPQDLPKSKYDVFFKMQKMINAKQNELDEFKKILDNFIKTEENKNQLIRNATDTSE